jgi:2-polyprenyl-3-methyl-5-hydroxy-6-metoxy-1,4-benzoquinol methylase
MTLINGLRSLRDRLTGVGASTNPIILAKNKILYEISNLREATSHGNDGGKDHPNNVHNVGNCAPHTGLAIASKEADPLPPNNLRLECCKVEKLLYGEAIRVAFIAQHPAIWFSWRSVWKAFSETPGVKVYAVLTPFIHPFSSTDTYDEMRQLLLDEGIPFFTYEFFDLNVFKPHVVFLQNPYDETRPAEFTSLALTERGCRVAYVPYGLEIGGGACNLNWQFDLPLQRSAWRIFARSDRHQRMFGKYCRSGNGHVVVVGHPKLDALSEISSLKIDESLQNRIAGRKVVLWTPHFSVGNPPAWSTFELYVEPILSAMEKRKDLFLLIRPHPMFFQAMLEKQVWDVGGEQQFKQRIANSHNLALDEDPNYLTAFAVSDALMADVGSFLLEFLPTLKPILYLYHPQGLGLNDDGEIVEHYYQAKSTDDIAPFLDMVCRGDDPMRLGREAAIPEYLYFVDGQVGKRICEHVVNALLISDSGRPNVASTLANQSEAYWREASTTYLAPPDYYDRKEDELRKLLAQLPRLNNVLDIGCGDGRFTMILAAHALAVDAFDISEKLINLAKEKTANAGVSNIRYWRGGIEGFSPDGMYDMVSCMEVTSCLIDDSSFIYLLDRVRSVTRHKGLLLLVDSLSESGSKKSSDQSGYVAHYRNVQAYCQSIQRRGFSLVQEITLVTVESNQLINKLFLFRLEGAPNEG